MRIKLVGALRRLKRRLIGGKDIGVRFFDAAWYARAYPEIRDNPKGGGYAHYLQYGWREGRSPHPLFSVPYYLSNNPDVAASGVEPFTHFLRRGWREGRDGHPLLQGALYREMWPDVAAARINPWQHYVSSGWKEGRDPHPLFDASFYLNGSIEAPFGAEPLAHYIEHGWRRGCDPHPLFSVTHYLRQCTEVDEPLAHFVREGWRKGIEPNPLFATAWYLAANPDVTEAGLNPLLHYTEQGWKEGRNPHPLFSVRDYLLENADVADGGLEPLMHYRAMGWRENRCPHPDFEPNWYLDANLDVAAAEVEPLSHYLTSGWREGRNPSARFHAQSYLQNNPDVAAAGLEPFTHFVLGGRSEGREPVAFPGEPTLEQNVNEQIVTVFADVCVARAELADQSAACATPSVTCDATRLADIKIGGGICMRGEVEFDEEYYRRVNPDIPAELDAFDHFNTVGWQEGRDPAPWFSTVDYLEANADVREAGLNPFLHYIESGWRENRPLKANKSIAGQESVYCDGTVEWSDYEAVRDRINSFRVAGEPDLEALNFCVALNGCDLDAEMQKLNFPAFKDRSIAVSILIPCMNQMLYTMECLASISCAFAQTDTTYEVVVFDNGSRDGTQSILSKIENLVYIRSEYNTGFGPGNNAAATAARGDFLFLLNNDAQLAPGAIDHMIKVMEGDDSVGAVGPKLLGFDGKLQEAGAYLSPCATGNLVGFGMDHRAPRFNYQREVEYVSAAAVMVRRSEFLELGGFDPIFAPAYCEDADLCYRLRQKGLKIVYAPEAVVAHHMSVTSGTDRRAGEKMRLAARSQQKFVGRWQRELIDAACDTRLIAFYLPQFHPIPENDLWWGKGFTEWTNVTAARPNYSGHRQPRRPADLGYYDLRLSEAMEAQVDLAKRYGVHGFCYYYYWFDGKRVLEKPLESMLATGKPDFPFCLCWANENWTRTWDGEEKSVLIEQSYSEENDLAVIADLARYMGDSRYIRVNGRPLLLVYRVRHLPNFFRTARVWRNYCRTQGFGEIYLASAESFELSARPESPRKFGCDVSVEFPPHGMLHDAAMRAPDVSADFMGAIHDYRNMAYEYAKREEPGFKRLRSVLVGWDNTPRRQNHSLVLEHATPGAFQAWLEWTIRRTREQNVGDERIVFINAWNEWCEGAYLEPDADYGHAYLQAVRNALDSML